MSVNSRLNWVAQQRVDLSDFLAMESFNAFDLRALVSSFVGVDAAYVIRGFEVTGKTGLTAQISVANSQVFNPQDGNGSFYVGLADDADVSVSLPSNQSNVYVEAKFTNESFSPVSRGLWDPLASTGEDASGAEYSSAVDMENRIVLQVSVNTTGFSEGAIPLFRAVTTTSISSMVDCRPMLFRLGTGGSSPNPLHKFGFSSTRQESIGSGTGVGDATDSPWRSRDSVGAINDKAFKSFKDWADAVMTRISETSGSPIWYANSLATAPAANISLNQVFFDTLGHNLQPSANASFKWKKSGGNYVLAGEGQLTDNTQGLIRWKSNYSNLEWHLGATFITNTRRYSDYLFVSDPPVDGGNVYLKLERETPKASGNSVKWADNSGYPSFTANKTVSGAPGDFTGIALGDYIRKESEGYSRYYKVVKSYDGTVYDAILNPLLIGNICSSSTTALELQNISDPTDIIVGGASIEPLRYFRARYNQDDLVSDSVANTFAYQDTNYYWLGRRYGSLFYLRDYGTMQEGEEVTTLDATFAQGQKGEGVGLSLEHSETAAFDGTSGYTRSSGNLIKIRRYKRDNTIDTPGSGDNSGSLIEYTISTNVGLIAAGEQLWVRLSDSSGGALSNGSVTNTSDDQNNTDVFTNRWEVRNAIASPIKNFDDKDIFLVARAVNIGSRLCLIFCDGSILSTYGQYNQNSLEVNQELRLTNRVQKSVLFIDQADSTGRVDTDTTQFFYDKTLGILGIRNFRISDSSIDVTGPADLYLFQTAGQKTISFGGPATTTVFQGNLVVAGNTVAAQVSEIMSEDKLISLGVGNALNGGYNSGLEVADNTYTPTTVSSSAGSTDLVITLPASPGYVLGDIIGVSTSFGIGNLPPGDISGKYTIVAALSTAGDATISGATLTIRLATTVPGTQSAYLAGFKVFKSEWAFKVTDADGATTGITSWMFQVKGVSTKPTLTPVLNYGTVPTAHSANMQSTRIPFVNNDNSGPSGADSTLNFSSDFAWNDSTKVLTVNGSITGVTFESFAHQVTHPNEPASGLTSVYAIDDYYLYQRTPDGNIELLTNVQGNVYEEVVDVVAVPSGNNQMAAIPTPPTSITLPKDTNKRIGVGLVATTDGSTSTVTVTKKNHGLATGELITVTASVGIGGISAGNLSVSGVACTVVNPNTFTYTALAASSFADSGNLDFVKAVSIRYYTVGNDELEVYLNGILLRRGDDYNEVGGIGNLSNNINWLIPIVLDDVITYRIDSNGGQIVINNAGGTTLQGAYAAGNIINTSFGVPVTINGTPGDKLLVINGDITVTGVLDPKGITFTQESSDPLSSSHYGLWVNTSGELIFKRGNSFSAQNITSNLISSATPKVVISKIMNNSGSRSRGAPISVNSLGELQVTDVTSGTSSQACIGILSADVTNGNYADVATSGRIENVFPSFTVGMAAYVNKFGQLTQTYPTFGVDGFTTGDYVIRAGVITKNQTNPSLRDLIVDLQIIGQLQ